jgi:hypothetical protein
MNQQQKKRERDLYFNFAKKEQLKKENRKILNLIFELLLCFSKLF